MKKDIYILCKPEEVSKVENSITDELMEIGNIKIVTTTLEIPQDKREILEIADIEDATRKSLNDIALDKMSEEKFREIAEQYYTYHKMPEVPTVEELVKENKTEFQKLSSFDRKEKNQARKRLEHQALKYKNRHYKK